MTYKMWRLIVLSLYYLLMVAYKNAPYDSNVSHLKRDLDEALDEEWFKDNSK